MDLAKRFSLCPGVHAVPPGIAITVDHSPEAQRWKEVPPRQFHMPSVVQAPVKPAVVGPEVVEFDEGDPVGVETAGRMEVATEEAAPMAVAEVLVATDAKVVETAPLPPELLTVGTMVGVVAATLVVLDVTAGAAFAPPAGEDAGEDEPLPPADVAFGEDAPLPPTGKQLVPTGFA
jgi:hypothetical protein